MLQNINNKEIWHNPSIASSKKEYNIQRCEKMLKRDGWAGKNQPVNLVHTKEWKMAQRKNANKATPRRSSTQKNQTQSPQQSPQQSQDELFAQLAKVCPVF
jgi:hypothetical protein